MAMEWAAVDDDGTLLRSSGGISSAKDTTGRYDVWGFANGSNQSAPVASLSGSSTYGPGEITVVWSGTGQFNVRTFDSSGTAVDHPFTIHVPS